jgi:hypothetical protein
MNIGLLRHGYGVTASRWLKKMLKVSTLSFNAGSCTSVHWLPDLLENSRCRTRHLRSILYYLLQVLEVADFRSINSRFSCPRDKSISDLNQGKDQPMLLVKPDLSIIPENMFFKNSRNVKWKCVITPSRMNHIWILDCTFTFCNSPGRMFHTKSLLPAPIRCGGTK